MFHDVRFRRHLTQILAGIDLLNFFHPYRPSALHDGFVRGFSSAGLTLAGCDSNIRPSRQDVALTRRRICRYYSDPCGVSARLLCLKFVFSSLSQRKLLVLAIGFGLTFGQCPCKLILNLL
jgi:hypothetical protein